jgi:hypothetical protein
VQLVQIVTNTLYCLNSIVMSCLEVLHFFPAPCNLYAMRYCHYWQRKGLADKSSETTSRNLELYYRSVGEAAMWLPKLLYLSVLSYGKVSFIGAFVGLSVCRFAALITLRTSAETRLSSTAMQKVLMGLLNFVISSAFFLQQIINGCFIVWALNLMLPTASMMSLAATYMYLGLLNCPDQYVFLNNIRPDTEFSVKHFFRWFVPMTLCMLSHGWPFVFPPDQAWLAFVSYSLLSCVLPIVVYSFISNLAVWLGCQHDENNFKHDYGSIDMLLHAAYMVCGYCVVKFYNLCNSGLSYVGHKTAMVPLDRSVLPCSLELFNDCKQSTSNNLSHEGTADTGHNYQLDRACQFYNFINESLMHFTAS